MKHILRFLFLLVATAHCAILTTHDNCDGQRYYYYYYYCYYYCYKYYCCYYYSYSYSCHGYLTRELCRIATGIFREAPLVTSRPWGGVGQRWAM